MLLNTGKGFANQGLVEKISTKKYDSPTRNDEESILERVLAEKPEWPRRGIKIALPSGVKPQILWVHKQENRASNLGGDCEEEEVVFYY